MLLYHHSRPLESVLFGQVKADPRFAEPSLKEEYSWLEKEVGFYPLFVAVGATQHDLRMTGYQDNWRRIIASETIGKDKNGNCIHRNILRKSGEFPNNVLFSFDGVDGIFMDYVNWHIVLNSSHNNYQITDYEKRLIFKPSWQKSRWLRKARAQPHTIQLVTPSLYLPAAKRIYVKNKETKGKLEDMGFANINVKNLKDYKL